VVSWRSCPCCSSLASLPRSHRSMPEPCHYPTTPGVRVA
jgi:hypothetical protein